MPFILFFSASTSFKTQLCNLNSAWIHSKAVLNLSSSSNWQLRLCTVSLEPRLNVQHLNRANSYFLVSAAWERFHCAVRHAPTAPWCNNRRPEMTKGKSFRSRGRRLPPASGLLVYLGRPSRNLRFFACFLIYFLYCRRRRIDCQPLRDVTHAPTKVDVTS